MKNRNRWFVVGIIAMGGALWFSNSLVAVEKTTEGTVAFDNGGIVLTGTDLSKTDEAAMNKILSTSDGALYRVHAYEKGKRTKTRGTLTDVVTNKQLASEIAANTKKAEFTHYVVQVCATTNPTSGANPAKAEPSPNTTNPTSGPNNASSANPKRCQELVAHLKPILEKYRRK